jgi:hypothetical protein
MREIKGISPTALHLWESDRERFYLDRLSDTRSPRDGQSPAAAVGSGFDAYVKSALHKAIFGHDGNGEYDRDRLFNEQVDDELNRAFAKRAAAECFKRYQDCGAFAELLVELTSSTKDPRFEFTLIGDVSGVPLVGKPDLYYFRDCHVLYDWKVMGYCSRSSVSPKKLYRSCRDTWTAEEAKPTRGGGQTKPHKNFTEIEYKGHKIGDHWMDEVDAKWADQLCIYGWLMGIPVGCEDFIVGIDQLCCKPADELEHPLIRVAQHRCRISEYFQLALMKRLQEMYTAITTGHIFDDVSREESDARIEILAQMHMEDPEDHRDDVWALCNERQFRG